AVSRFRHNGRLSAMVRGGAAVLVRLRPRLTTAEKPEFRPRRHREFDSKRPIRNRPTRSSLADRPEAGHRLQSRRFQIARRASPAPVDQTFRYPQGGRRAEPVASSSAPPAPAADSGYTAILHE